MRPSNKWPPDCPFEKAESPTGIRTQPSRVPLGIALRHFRSRKTYKLFLFRGRPGFPLENAAELPIRRAQLSL